MTLISSTSSSSTKISTQARMETLSAGALSTMSKNKLRGIYLRNEAYMRDYILLFILSC